MKLDILVFAAHPDDAELGCGGTIAKHVSLGHTVGIVDLTRGELGTRGTIQTRAEEAAESARILGVSVRENLQLRDGFFLNDEHHQLKLIERIRHYRPEIVLANAIHDRHPDHGQGAQLRASNMQVRPTGPEFFGDAVAQFDRAWGPRAPSLAQLRAAFPRG